MKPIYCERSPRKQQRTARRRGCLLLALACISVLCLLLLGAVPPAPGAPAPRKAKRRKLQEHDKGPKLSPQALLDRVLAQPQHPPGRHSACDALLHVPKVALLFMTPGEMPHERLWRAWVERAAGLLPAEALRRYVLLHGGGPGGAATGGGSVGGPEEGEDGGQAARLAEVAEACGALLLGGDSSSSTRGGGGGGGRNQAAGPLVRQVLFTFYLHAPPGFKGYPASSLFGAGSGGGGGGTLIPHRVEALRQRHSLVHAERLLLAEALRDPLNQRFLLLSETTLPLYGPATLYAQALGEGVSRLDACTSDHTLYGNLDRWDDRMAGPTLQKHHWRKTSMWFSLLRSHAEVIVRDREINEAFEKYCIPRHKHPITHRGTSCTSSEHYPAIVLAVHGLAAETTCNGGGSTFVDWSKGLANGHPRSFAPGEVHGELVLRARLQQCTLQQTEAAEAAAVLQFVNASALAAPGPSQLHLQQQQQQLLLPPQQQQRLLLLPQPPPYPALSPNCSLFARKFPDETEPEVLRVFSRFFQPRGP